MQPEIWNIRHNTEPTVADRLEYALRMMSANSGSMKMIRSRYCSHESLSCIYSFFAICAFTAAHFMIFSGYCYSLFQHRIKQNAFMCATEEWMFSSYSIYACVVHMENVRELLIARNSNSNTQCAVQWMKVRICRDKIWWCSKVSRLETVVANCTNEPDYHFAIRRCFESIRFQFQRARKNIAFAS